MPVIIRKSCPADRNIPTVSGGHRLVVTVHADGDLAGFTTVEGDARALRVFKTGGGWRDLSEGEKPVDAEVDIDAWAAGLVSGTVGKLEDALRALNPADLTVAHVEALVAAESAGKDRSSAMSVINQFGDAVKGE